MCFNPKLYSWLADKVWATRSYLQELLMTVRRNPLFSTSLWSHQIVVAQCHVTSKSSKVFEPSNLKTPCDPSIVLSFLSVCHFFGSVFLSFIFDIYWCLTVPYMSVRILDHASRVIPILSSSDPLPGVSCILAYSCLTKTFRSPASIFQSLWTRLTLRTLLQVAVALTMTVVSDSWHSVSIFKRVAAKHCGESFNVEK